MVKCQTMGPTGSDERRAKIEANLGYVHRIAKQVHERCARSVDFDDIVSYGIIGLIQAIDAYDADRGVPFGAFARLRIAGAMRDHLRVLDWMPRGLRTRLNEIDEEVKRFTDENGRPPTRDEIVQRRRWTKEQVDDAFRIRSGTVSLDQLIDKDDGIGDVIKDHRQEPNRQLDLLRSIGRNMGQRERLIILLYYYSGLTMREIGLTLNISESRVSQIHSDLIVRLRKNRTVRDYFGMES